MRFLFGMMWPCFLFLVTAAAVQPGAPEPFSVDEHGYDGDEEHLMRQPPRVPAVVDRVLHDQPHRLPLEYSQVPFWLSIASSGIAAMVIPNFDWSFYFYLTIALVAPRFEPNMFKEDYGLCLLAAMIAAGLKALVSSRTY